MKHIPAMKAIRFGFRTVIKNPLFFILAAIVSEALLLVGLVISFVIALPFFLPLIEFIYRIIDILKKGLLSGFMKGVGAGAAGSAARGGGFPLGGGGLGIGKGGLLKGVGGSILETLENLKEIIAEIFENPWIFILFAMGVLVFLLLAKMVYDFIIIGWTNISLDFSDKGSSSLRSLFSSPSVFFTYFIATMIFGIIVLVPHILVGMLLLLTNMGSALSFIFYSLAIITNLWLGFKFFFYAYFIIDKNEGIVGSLRKSYKIQGAISQLFILFGILSAIMFICYVFGSLLPFIIGLPFVALSFAVLWIVGYLSFASLYRSFVRK